MSKLYKLEKLKKENFEQVWSIMESSFPIDERRTRENQEMIIDNPHYFLYGCRKDAEIMAFFAVWKLESLAFVEHFAVDERFRNGGIGAGLLQELLQVLDVPVVLEVEFPKTELQQRRIRFYERNGFVLNPYDDYVQPALSDAGKALPLMIMTYPKDVSREQYEQIRDTLYREVYHVNGKCAGIE
ncbi:MAG: GNAT family N-acetyltransferase [Clostridiales bacterium]|nr:GNAT family N-acetyltransferase [Roseburia sp.]MDD7638509.1 GNAT family N-acetyltransferase [Clostridiales bacterium]MDY4112447.1 GNAT family N-acetyltransferase [Roseburia sp.]